MDDNAHGEPEEVVDLAHPLGVALGQVVVDGDHVHTAAGEGVEVHGKSGDEGLAFAGFHLGDLALVQDHAADELDVEVAHVEHAPAGLADNRERLRKDFVQDFIFGAAAIVVVLDAGGALLDEAAEFLGFGAQFGVGEALHLGFERVDLLHPGHEALDLALVFGAENLGD